MLDKIIGLASMATTSNFKSEDKLKDKSDYHAWKMTLDLTLEEHDAMDYAQGRVVEPPSNAPAVAKMKYKKGEVKAKTTTASPKVSKPR